MAIAPMRRPNLSIAHLTLTTAIASAQGPLAMEYDYDSGEYPDSAALTGTHDGAIRLRLHHLPETP